jgi:hypothetical protein
MLVRVNNWDDMRPPSEGETNWAGTGIHGQVAARVGLILLSSLPAEGLSTLHQ